ncbi:MAG: serine/threonine protein kinase [Kouleothrix sp.]|nr:serine/threonine protein kinase [Kouleothrix sp.]
MAQPSELTQIAQAICGNKGLSFIAKVGEGAFKETFHVKDDQGGSLALKVYKSNTHQERNDREIQAMRTCNHPGVARLFSLETFVVGQTTYFSTTEEYLAGGPLTDKLKNQGLMSAPAIISLGAHLIDAIAHIASHDFVHRDLKPDNIMFREDGQTAVVVDFGIVRQLNAESLTGTWAMRGPGSPYYAAPEQLNNDKELIDWRTDQFSLGIVLAFCAFGQHPFEAGNQVLTVEHVAQHGRPSADFLRDIQAAGLPALEKMVAPWPYERYRTPQELAAAWSSQAAR